MRSFLVKRLISGVLLLITVSVLSFSLLYIMPGTAIDYLVEVDATDETVARITAKYGLDQPLHIQYFRWLGNLLRGDLGESLQSKIKVANILKFRLPITLRFTLWAFALRLLISIPLGVFCALKKGGFLDKTVMAISSFLQAIPNFWLGILLILFFSVKLGWFPLNGYGTSAHFILPTATLAAGGIANSIRLTKAEALTVRKERYVLTAYAKGLPERRVIVRHVLRNSLILVMVMAFMSIPYLISGAMIIENLFVIPGMGTIITQSIKTMDFPVVQASVLLIAALVILCNIASDIITSMLDPRVRDELE